VETLVTITPIAPPPNLPPTANAGGDQNVVLPLPNGIQLNGAASDADGTIADVLWSQISGSSSNIVSPTSLITKVNGLVEGIYSFRLSVTDDKGATTTDDVTVTVAAAQTGYTLIYQNGFDTIADLDPFDHGQIGNGSLSTTIFKTGPGSFKSVPANVSSGIRSEVQFDDGQTPLEGIVEYDVYYNNFFSDSGHSFQWHPTTSGGSGTGLYHKNGLLQFVTVKSGTSGTNVGNPFSVSTKVWHHVKMTYKFGTSGYIRLELDGVEKVNSNVQMGDGSRPYMKVGVNMWVNQVSVVYYDNLKVYQKN
jgi:hypothetical protein